MCHLRRLSPKRIRHSERAGELCTSGSWNEFTTAGELVPSDPIEWPDGEDCPTGSIGAECGTVVGEVFQSSTGRVLVSLGVCGVSVPVLYKTRASFLRFAKDWPAPLATLNHAAAIDDIGSRIEDTLDELDLEQVMSVQPPAPRVDPSAGAN